MTEIKEKLYNFCVEFVQQRIEATQKAIDDATEAQLSDTKSSAGDKYETGRAMAQQEIDRNKQQRMEALRLKSALEQINPNHCSSNILPGSLAITNQGNFYVAISARQVTIQKVVYFAVSPASPIGLKLKGLHTQDEFILNGKTFIIQQIY